MTGTRAPQPERRADATLTTTGALLACVSLSMLSFYLLPATPIASWSLLGPLSSFRHAGAVSAFEAVSLAALTAVTLMLFRPGPAADPREHAHSLWGLTGIYLLLFAFTGVQVSVTGFEPYNNCAAVLVAVVVGLLSARLCGSAKRALLVLTVLAVIQAVIAICDLTAGQNVLWSGNVPRAGGTFNQPIHLATFVVCVIPTALVQMIRARSAAPLGAWCCVLAVLIGALALTWMRGGVIAGLMSATFVVYACYRNWKLSLAVMGLGTLLCGGVALWRSHDALDATSTARSNFGRTQAWKRGLALFARHPLSGIGLGATELPVEVYSGATSEKLTSGVRVEPKNLLLHWADELGVGGVLLFGLLAYSIAGSLRGFRQDTAIALGGAWLGLAIAGLADTPFGVATRPCGNVLVGTLLGATMLHAAGTRAQAGDETATPARKAAGNAQG